jgi:hypothetical protein
MLISQHGESQAGEQVFWEVIGEQSTDFSAFPPVVPRDVPRFERVCQWRALYVVATQEAGFPNEKAANCMSLAAFVLSSGRCERIRTFDPLHPMQVRYQAAPHTDKPQIIACCDALSEVVAEEIADFEQLAAHKLQPLLRGSARGQVRAFAVFEVGVVRRVLKIVEYRIAALKQRIAAFEHFNAFKHDLAVAALVAFNLDDFLKLVARAADGEALVIEQVADAADHEHLMVLVVAAVAASFHRAQLRKLLLPITEHVRFDAAQIADFTDGEVTFRRNGWEGFLQLNQCAKEETSKSTLSRKLAQRVAWVF